MTMKNLFHFPLPMILLSSFCILMACENRGSTMSSRLSQSPQRNPEPKIALGLNDVAIMFPYESHPDMIAKAPTADAFIPSSSIDEIKKILIDDQNIHKKENFAFGKIGDEAIEADIALQGAKDGPTPFRLASIRVDPCGNSIGRVATGDACAHEVRMVWQPLELVDSKVFTRDLNLHSIYRLDDSSFASFLQGLRSLRSSSAAKSEALQPHPIMAEEGSEGPYFKGLIQLLTASVGPKNLHRIAFFADTNPSFMGHWPMLAFDIVDGAIVRSPSPTLGHAEGEVQKIVQRIEGAPRRLGEPLPTGKFANNLFPLFDDTVAKDEAEMLAFFGAFLTKKYVSALAIDNPTIHEPANADCASCHMATIEKFKVKREMDSMGLEIPKVEFTSNRWNLETKVDENFSNTSLQIFSYFQSQSKIAPRAIHDAAHSADMIEAMGL
jgi:hypothetical protein